jgi:hypothetical protein
VGSVAQIKGNADRLCVGGEVIGATGWGNPATTVAIADCIPGVSNIIIGRISHNPVAITI